MATSRPPPLIGTSSTIDHVHDRAGPPALEGWRRVGRPVGKGARAGRGSRSPRGPAGRPGSWRRCGRRRVIVRPGAGTGNAAFLIANVPWAVGVRPLALIGRGVVGRIEVVVDDPRRGGRGGAGRGERGADDEHGKAGGATADWSPDWADAIRTERVRGLPEPAPFPAPGGPGRHCPGVRRSDRHSFSERSRRWVSRGGRHRRPTVPPPGAPEISPLGRAPLRRGQDRYLTPAIPLTVRRGADDSLLVFRQRERAWEKSPQLRVVSRLLTRSAENPRLAYCACSSPSILDRAPAPARRG